MPVVCHLDFLLFYNPGLALALTPVSRLLRKVKKAETPAIHFLLHPPSPPPSFRLSLGVRVHVK